MSVGPDVATGDIPAPQLRRPLKTVWRIVKSQPRATVGMIIVLFFIGVALTAPWLAPYGVTEKVGPVVRAALAASIRSASTTPAWTCSR